MQSRSGRRERETQVRSLAVMQPTLEVLVNDMTSSICTPLLLENTKL